MRILGLIATLVILGQPLMAETAPPMISVTGEGRINVAPDMATIMLGVTTEADTAKEAMDANSERLSGAIAALKAAGIEDKDIQTTGLNLGPRYDYNRTKSDGTPQITGFIAQNNVTVRVRAIGTLGGVLDAVVSDGANTLNGVTFGLQNPDPALDEARKAAVADARRKAELYAGAAGVTLGAIQSIGEQSGYAPPMPMALEQASFAKDASVPVAAGEVGVTANVSIVWLLGQ